VFQRNNTIEDILDNEYDRYMNSVHDAAA